jgi:hypothetical protein
MDDRIAREGTLVRCNADRDALAADLECINARRAAAAIAARSEAAERDMRDAASEARLLAARQRYDAQQAAARDAELAAQAEEERAYEAQWVEQPGEPVVGNGEVSASPGSMDAEPTLEPITLPRSALPPLMTIGLPAGAKPIEYEPPKPTLEEIVVPDRRKSY